MQRMRFIPARARPGSSHICWHREVFVNPEGQKMSRLKDVDDDWILRRLERWGQSSRMPFLGPEKAKIIQDIMQDVRPMVVVEVGTMCGYSAIKLAQALPPGAAHILLHLMIAHAATETSTSQASPGSDTYESSHSMLRVH
jgi:hypothetical protein